MSLKKKFKYVYIISGCIIAMTLIISIFLSIRGMVVFTYTLEQNDKAMNLCNAIADERKLFKTYTEDEQPFALEQLSNAQKNTQYALSQISFDYKDMNEEQYILMQSIYNTYDSYKDIFKQVVNMNPENEEYRLKLDKYYKVQQYLEGYAKDFESLTVAMGSEYYNNQKKLFYIIPTICVFIAFVVIMLFMWLKHFISKKIVEPVLALSNEAKRISMNDFSGNDLTTDGDDEISMLIKSFVEMKYSTKNYITTLKEKHKVEKQLEEMRFEMLKNQINPHFLFNTLNLIAGTAQIEDAQVTEKMIITLSRLFRYNLKTQTSIMPLKQEIKVVGDYMYLQQMRFGQRIKYICNATDECLEELVPSFVLQPLVENAIIHGLSNSSEGGLIYVRCWKKNEYMYMSVADTGLGIEHERLMKIRSTIDGVFDSDEFENNNELQDLKSNQKTVGVGLGNIAQRVKGMYDDSGMKVYSHQGCGTIIQVYFNIGK